MIAFKFSEFEQKSIGIDNVYRSKEISETNFNFEKLSGNTAFITSETIREEHIVSTTSNDHCLTNLLHQEFN